MDAYQVPKELFDKILNTSHRTSPLYTANPADEVYVGIQKYGTLMEINFTVNGQIAWVVRFTSA